MPILFLLTLAISLPALYVLNVLFGPRLDLRTCVRLLALAVSVNAAALASYIPFSALFTLSASRGDYHSLVMMHFIAFSLASLASMAVVAMLFRAAAQARGVRWRPLFVGVWLFLYAFIGLKMVWILRPWIGDWDREYTALRDIRGSIYGSLYRMITQTEEIYIELPSPSTQENRP